MTANALVPGCHTLKKASMMFNLINKIEIEATRQAQRNECDDKKDW